MGFGLLIAIVGGMFFYLSSTLFFFFNERWVIPLILSPQHAKVSEAKIAYMQQTYQLRKLEAEKISISEEISYINYASDLYEDYHNKYIQAINFELNQDSKRLSEISGLLDRYQVATKLSEKRQASFGQTTAKSLDSQFKLRLIDKSQMLSGQYMLSQLNLSSLNSQERLTQLEHKKIELEQKIMSYESLRSKTGKPRNSKITSDALSNHHQILRSLVEKAELVSKLSALRLRDSSLDELLAQYRKIKKNLELSPYIRASESPVTVALVPYDNLSKVRVNEPVFTCLYEFVWCKKIGIVKMILPGETSMRSPLKSEEIRGQMIELELDDNSWGEARALMVGRPPLFF